MSNPNWQLDKDVRRGRILPPATETFFYNYKEPLRPFEEDGKTLFGYVGTVATNKDRTHVQCHYCGYFFKTLSMHVKTKHGLTVRDYKQHVGLMQKTSLMGEALRERRIEAGQIRGFKDRKTSFEFINNNPEILKRQRASLKNNGGWVLEKRNETGMCPDQLLDKIKVLATELGHTPSWGDFIYHYDKRYINAIKTVFGTWSAAVKQLGMTPVKEAQRYSDEALIEYVINFYDVHGRPPAQSDARRGLIPSGEVYRRRFGGLRNARELAGIPHPTNAPRYGVAA